MAEESPFDVFVDWLWWFAKVFRRKFRHQSFVFHAFLPWVILKIILYLSSDDVVLRTSSACVSVFSGFKLVPTDFQNIRSFIFRFRAAKNTCFVFGSSRGGGRIWEFGSQSAQGKCSMIDTSDIVICHTSKGKSGPFSYATNTKKRKDNWKTTDHPWRVKSQLQIHWINGAHLVTSPKDDAWTTQPRGATV